MSVPSNLSEQVLAAPEGAGGVRGAEQTFRANPQNGTGRYVVPIKLYAGHGGLVPSLSLVYSTHGGSGIAGQGWSLNLASVKRRLDRGVPGYTSEDRFTYQGEELLPVGGDEYRPRIETRFSRLYRRGAPASDYWEVAERDGTRCIFGAEPDHRLHDDHGRIASWWLSRRTDANGNTIDYRYRRDRSTRETLLVAMSWGRCYRVALHYEDRPDPVVSHRPGFEYRRNHRLQTIELQVRERQRGPFRSFRRYTLAYRLSALTGHSLLAAVSMTGIGADGSGEDFPAYRFGYTAPTASEATWHILTGAVPGRSLADPNTSLVHQSGSGLPDILETRDTGFWLRQNLGGGHFSTPRLVSGPAQVRLDLAGTFLSDMDGDGWGDLAVGGGRRVYRGVAGGGWSAAVVSPAPPSVDLDDPDVRVADLNGNGLPDVLRSGAGGWTCFENLGSGRWAPAQTVPRPPAAPLDRRGVALADISGDGLPDLLYATRRRILVWPGQGGGRFGEPWPLENAPDLGAYFDPESIRWIDMTGSGRADMVHAAAGRVTVYPNLAGVALGAAIGPLGVRQSSRGHVEPADLLGTGTRGLLFSDETGRSGAWRFLQFLAAPPDLLETIDNGLGRHTELVYSTSAAAWLRDANAGTPWDTSMPMSQRVIVQIHHRDDVTGSHVATEYQYRDGVYDGVEREFRGFSLVDEIERDSDGQAGPRLTRTQVRRWYHTGGDEVFRSRFHPLAVGGLDDEVPDLPWARRSLRGRLRREEVFALDGDPVPFSVREIGYRVFPVAREGGGPRYSYAPLATVDRMTMTERSREHRIVETKTIYDLHSGRGYGLSTKTVRSARGRAIAGGSAHQRQQAQPLEVVVETSYRNRDLGSPHSDSGAVPAYLVGKPGKVERYGIVNGRRSLLSQDCYYYDGEPFQGLGYPGSGKPEGVTRGRLSARLSLAFTNALLAVVYPSASGAKAAFAARGGYLRVGDSYYVQLDRRHYDERGMVIAALDPLGHQTSFEYDSDFGLFPVARIDTAGNPTALTRGRLPFQLARVTDPNGNVTSFRYNALGLLASRADQGKHVAGSWQGDPPEHPTRSYRYGFTSTPVVVTTGHRLTRGGQLAYRRRFIDGFSRPIQERHDAEPDPVDGRARFRVSGRQVFDHRGRLVRQYGPYFSDRADFEYEPRDAAFLAFAYDPIGRPVATQYPDGTTERTEAHPWMRTVYDRNDSLSRAAGGSEIYAAYADRLADHAGTATRIYFDGFGREIAVEKDAGNGALQVERSVLNLRGEVIEAWDGRDLAHPTWRFSYSFHGRRIASTHLTGAGQRHVLPDAAGNPIWTRDGRGVEVEREFGPSHRPLREWSRLNGARQLRRRWRYVDFTPGDAQLVSLQAGNLVGRLLEVLDQAGARGFTYDWRGLTTAVSYRFWDLRDNQGRGWDDPESALWATHDGFDRAIPDDNVSAPSWLELPGRADSTTVTVYTDYDTAGRPVRIGDNEGAWLGFRYHVGGRIAAIDAGTIAAESLSILGAADYNARGQVTRVIFGNGVETRRSYDDALDRMTNLTTRATSGAGMRYQDLDYFYDPVGNPLEIVDNLATVSDRDPLVVPNTRNFFYDPLYRLTAATGVMHAAAENPFADPVEPQPAAAQYVPYRHEYRYDAVGNFVRNSEFAVGQLTYKAGLPDLFEGVSPVERDPGPGSGVFRYDANGSAVATPRCPSLGYTHDGQVLAVDAASGARVRYLRNGPSPALRIALEEGVARLRVHAEPFEYEVQQGQDSYALAAVEVAGVGRHARAERVLEGNGAGRVDLFFVHPDHLGSGHILTRADGSLLNQEEFLPMGRSSDRRDNSNRRRFIGVERDPSTGLCLTGPRTYDPITGRFLQADPLAAGSAFTSPYVYADGCPIRRLDPSGFTSGNFDDSGGVTYDPSDTGGGLELDDDPKLAEIRAQYDADAKDIAAGNRRVEKRLDRLKEVRSASVYANDIGTGESGFFKPKFGDDPLLVTRMQGIGDGLMQADFEHYMSTVEMLGEHNDEFGTEFMDAAEKHLHAIEARENEARALAGMAPRPDVLASTDQYKRARIALEKAGSAFKRGLPVVGFFMAGQSLYESKQYWNQGEYLTAGSTAAAILYDPLDWGMAAANLRDFATASWQIHQAEKTSASIMAEIERIESER